WLPHRSRGSSSVVTLPAAAQVRQLVNTCQAFRRLSRKWSALFRAVRPVKPQAISVPASGVGRSRTEDLRVATQVVLMGLGAIGRLIARAVLTRSDLEIVAAIDLDAQRVGRKLSDVVDAPAPDVIVTPDAGAALKKAQHGVLLHATGSRLDRVEGELAQALSAGLAVVSTCEELSYPWLRHPEI